MLAVALVAVIPCCALAAENGQHGKSNAASKAPPPGPPPVRDPDLPAKMARLGASNFEMEASTLLTNFFKARR